MNRLRSAIGPLQRRFSQVNLREHEDKILVMLALVISAVVGLVVVAFLAITESMGRFLVSAGPAQRFLSPLLGSLIAGWLLFRFFPDSRGSGIPQTRVALVLQKGLITLRTAIGKFICSAISLGSGIALGREGPSVHIGAGIASYAGRRLGLSEVQVRSLIPVGTAAAVAAAFNTPLAAVLFTLEEILTDLHARVVGTVVIGAATSWIVLRLILGDEPLFHVPAYQLVHPIEFLLYALLGLAGGVVSTGFVKFLLWQRAWFLKLPSGWKAFAPAAGGLTVGLLALIQPGVIGVGYNLVSDALNGRMELKVMLILLVLKMIATSTSYGSGNAGGIFGPSLFIGAMLGGALGQAAHTLMPDHTGNAGAYALVGMGAAFAGIVRTPMTSVIMIFEVTRDYTIIVPLMIANLCSYLLAQRLQKMPLYEALSAQEGIIMPSPEHGMEPLRVVQALEPAEPSSTASAATFVHPDDPLDTALQRMGEAGTEEIVVLSRAGAKPLGVLSLRNVMDAYRKPVQRPSQEAQDWVPAVTAITVATVLIVSGLVFWQRSRQTDLGGEEYSTGRQLIALGQTDDAVAAFRNALSHSPKDMKSRAALGLALVESGHLIEASSYLSEVSKGQPQNGPVRAGLAKIALASGRKSDGLELYRQALAKDWPAEEETRRRSAQVAYATALTDAGRKSESIAVLLSVVEQSGSDATTGREAAETVRSIGSLEQAEVAYVALAAHFPGDATVWHKLGDIRYSRNEDTLALEAYRSSLRADPDEDLRRALANLEEILRLDPTRQGLSKTERTQRWELILERIVDTGSSCALPEQLTKVDALLKLKQRQPNASIPESQASAVAREIWQHIGSSCRTDSVLTHIMGKL